MTKDEATAMLAENGLTIKHSVRTKNDQGWRLDLANGAIVNVFDTGKLSFQGQNSESVRALLEPSSSESVVGGAPNVNTKVFVVYGHDDAARNQLEVLLRRWDLEPLILDQLPSSGQTIIEKLEAYTDDIGFAVVLATPDDEGHKADHPDERLYRARQNVVLELGMLLAKLGRARVAIVMKQSDKMERPSDIQGLIYIPFKDDLSKEANVLLAKEMNAAGYNIPVKKL